MVMQATYESELKTYRFANGHYKYTSAVSSDFCGVGYSLNWCVTIPEMPPSLSLEDRREMR